MYCKTEKCVDIVGSQGSHCRSKKIINNNNNGMGKGKKEPCGDELELVSTQFLK